VKDFGFTIHHGKGDRVTLNKWLLEGEPSRIPCYSTHNLGVGGIVLSPCKQGILVIKENHGKLMHLWKFPGGLVDEGETIEQAAIREVWEETGVKARYLGVLGFREQLNFRFGQGDLYFTCLMQADTEVINKCELEIFDAKWMPIKELKQESFYAMAGEVTRHIGDLFDGGLLSVQKLLASADPLGCLTLGSQTYRSEDVNGK